MNHVDQTAALANLDRAAFFLHLLEKNEVLTLTPENRATLKKFIVQVQEMSLYLDALTIKAKEN